MSETKKWTSTAGPIQTKRVSQALNNLRSQHNVFIELSGVKGAQEHRAQLYSPFSANHREDVTAAWNQIGEKYQWTVTSDTCKQIEADIQGALTNLAKTIPVKDERRTPEQEAERLAKCQAYDNERAAKEAKDKVEIDALVAELMKQYPWAIAKGPRLSDHARAAANLKEELIRAFPGIRFSVKSDYSSIDVRWHLGPTSEEVRNISRKYAYGTFDAMTDCSGSDESLRGRAVEKVLGRVRHVDVQRDFDYRQPMAEQVAKLICESVGVTWEGWETVLDPNSIDHRTASDAAHTTIASTSFPIGCEIVGVEPLQGKPGWKLVLLQTSPAPAVPTGGTGGASVRRNLAKDGVEIHFPSKPGAETLARLKGAGWRWSMHSHCWYARYSDRTFAFAHELLGLAIPTPAEKPDPAGAYVQAQEDAYLDSQAAAIGA